MMHEKISFDELLKERFVIDRPIRLIEMFGGIGSQAKSLERLEQAGLLKNGFERYKLIEFDKYAIKSYNAVHSTNFEPLDITKIKADDLEIVDKDKYIYIYAVIHFRAKI